MLAELASQLLQLMPRAGRQKSRSLGFSEHEWPRREAEVLVGRHIDSAQGAWRQFLRVHRGQLEMGGGPMLVQLALADPDFQAEAAAWMEGQTLLIARRPSSARGPCLSVVKGSTPLVLHPDGRRALLGPTLSALEGGSSVQFPAFQTALFLDQGERVMLASGHRVTLYNVEGGTPLGVFEGHKAPVLALAQHQSQVLSAGQDHTILLWDPESGQVSGCFDEHWGPVTDLQFYAPAQLVAACLDGHLYLYSLAHRTRKATLETAGPVAALAVEPPRVHAALACGEVETWNLETLTREGTRATGCTPLLAIAARHGQVAAAGQDGSIYVGDQVLRGHTGPVRSLAFQSDGTLLSASQDGTLRSWDPAQTSGALRGHGVPLRAVRSYGEHLMSAASDGLLLDEEHWLHRGPTCCLSPVLQDRLVSGDEDGTLKLWEGSECVTTWQVDGQPQVMGWLDSHTVLVVSEKEQDLTLAAYREGALLWSQALPWQCRPPRALGLEVLPSGEVMTFGNDASVHLVTRNQARAVRHHQQSDVRAVVFPDGVFSVGYHELACWRHDGSLVQSWPKRPMGHTTLLARHPHQELVAEWSPSGPLIHLWRLDGTAAGTLAGHFEGVQEAVFTETHLFSIGRDQCLRAFQLDSGENVATWVAECELTCLHLCADGSLAVGTRAGGLLRCDLR